MFSFFSSPKNQEVIRLTSKMGNGAKDAMRRGLYISGKEMTKFLKGEMTKKGRSGRKYKIYKGLGGRLLKQPRIHTASTPQEWPAVITGDFRKSIDFLVKGFSRMEFGSGKNFAEKYTKFLESRNKPVQRTVSQFKGKVKTNINKEIEKALCK